MRCALVLVSFSWPSETARWISNVFSRTSPHWRASASCGRRPAYARTEISVASRGFATARIASTVAGASGFTSLRRGRAIFRTTRTGLRASRPPSTARCRMVPSRSNA